MSKFNRANRRRGVGACARPIQYAVLMALAQGWHGQADAQSYLHYDGSRSEDYAGAVASWANAAEFQSDWGLAAMNAQYAYALGFSGAGVKVGAVDSGLRLTHQEFSDTSARSVTALGVSGSYLDAGTQRTPRWRNPRRQDGRSWAAGEAFDVPGAFDPAFNDNHGNHVSGTIAAANNGVGMMGVAWGANYYIANTHGTDSSIYGANMDYNYFKQAYGNLAAAGVRVINSSWGSPYEMDNYGTVAGVTTAYRVLEGAGKKSWLDAAADVSLETGVLQVYAAGNAGSANVNVRSALPYFRPELESLWVTATGLSQTLGTQYNKCGLAKYWCVAAPSSSINSLNGEAGDDAYRMSSGTSMAAPHVTGALGVLMERYPTLGNEAIRTILLSTSRQPNGAAGIPTDVPNTTFGWGVPDLQIAMNGPGQLLGRFEASLPTGVSDTWSNAISDKAWQARKVEEKTEIDAWSATDRPAMQAKIDALPTADAMLAGIANAKSLLQTAINMNTESGYTTSTARNTAVANVSNDPIGAVLLAMYEDTHPAWTHNNLGRTSLPTDFDEFVASRTDAELADAALRAVRAQLRTELDLRQARIDGLSAKTDADYMGSLVKSGGGTLVLTGANSYTGGTELKEGALGVGHSEALGTGRLAVANAATLQATADGLNLANAMALNGNGIVDTQAYGLTLSGAIADGEAAGGLIKAGSGTLTLSGTNTYSGPTGVAEGVLRAGAAGSFSARSSFAVNSGAQLDLGSFSQNIGSLSGGGKVLLGSATLGTGADNQSTTFAGEISGEGGIAKTGNGTLALTGANSYAGGTALKGGRLDLGNSGALGSGRLAIDDGTTLGFAAQSLRLANAIELTGTQDPVIDTGAFDAALDGVISGEGGMAKTGNGTLTLTGANSYAGGTVLKGGRLDVGNAGALGSGRLAMDDGTTLGFAAQDLRLANAIELTGTQDPVIDTGAFDAALDGAVSGTGFLTKIGAGTLTTTAANSYSGATVVAEGRLRAGAAGSFSPSSAVTVQPGTVLDLAGHTQRIGGMRNAGTVSLPGSSNTAGTTLTVTGPWSGQGGLLRVGVVGAGVDRSDRVLLSGAAAVASGSTVVQIGEVANLGAPTLGKGVEVVGTEGGARVEGQAFSLLGNHIDGGPFSYKLNNDGTGSYLSSFSAQGQPYYRSEVPMIAAVPGQLREAGLAMLGNLRLRVGEDEPRMPATQDGAGAPQATDGRHAWGRVISTDIDIRQGGTTAAQSQGRMNGFQVGSDVLALGQWHVGAYVGQLEGDASLSGSIDGPMRQALGANDVRGRYAGLYGTWRGGGLYADAVLQAGHESYTLRPAGGAPVAGKGDSLLASLEVGRGFALGDSGWQVEPQLQLVHQRQDLDDARIAGAAVVQDVDNSWLARAGMQISGRMALGAGILQPYGRLNIYHRFDGTDVASYVSPAATAQVGTPFGGTSTELAAGFTLHLSRTTALYGEIGRMWATGGASEVKSSFDGSLGLRMRW